MFTIEITMLILELVAAAIATFYLTHALTETTGYKGVFDRLRRSEDSPLHCFTCTAIWVGVLFGLLIYIDAFWLVVPFALAGAASLIYRLTLK